MRKTSFKIPNIGIVGLGFVGGALRRYFESLGANLFLYDKYKKIGSPEEINEADAVFLALPTPYRPKKGFDSSALEEVVETLKGRKIVVIKSTVRPGTTEMFQKKYPRHKFMFNPEFLREASAYEDLIKPDRQIIGVTKKVKKRPKK